MSAKDIRLQNHSPPAVSTDEELSRYVEIPKGVIRHARELPPEQSPLGGSLVRIARKAEGQALSPRLTKDAG